MWVMHGIYKRRALAPCDFLLGICEIFVKIIYDENKMKWANIFNGNKKERAGDLSQKQLEWI